jgi:AbrB family looped-hinge helix DNA binding protein
MKIGKRGTGLAIRIPAAIAKKLNLKPGDEMQITVTGGQKFEVCKMEKPESEADGMKRRLEAIEEMRKMSVSLPADFVFNREEIHERDWMRRFKIEPMNTSSS